MANKELTAKFRLDTSQFDEAIKSSTAKLKKMGKSMQDVGKTMSMAITAPIVAFGALSVKAFNTQEDAEMKLRAALQANGREVDSLFNKYAAFASEMQELTVVGDETTLQLLQLAETFGITGASAERAAKNAIAMEAAFGISAQGAIKMTSALEQGDTTMLTRYIPALKGIESEAGKVAFAQDVLAKSFDVAKAQAQTAGGQMKQLQNAFGDLMEQVGAIITEAITPLVKRLRGFVDRLQGVDKAKKKLIITIAALMAAVGPLLVGLGLFVGSILPAMIAGFGALFSPVTLIIGAIAALAAGIIYIAQNWDAVKERISDIGWWRNALIQLVQWVIEHNPTELLRKGVNALIEFFGGDPIPNPFEGMAAQLEKLKVETKEYQHQFGSFGDAVKATARSAMDALGLVNKETEESIQAQSELNEVVRTGAGVQRMANVAKVQGISQLQTMASVIPQVAGELVRYNEQLAYKTFLEQQALATQDFLANSLMATRGALEGLFSTMLNGGNVFQFIGQMLKRLAAQLAAAAAMALILKALLPAGGAIGGVASGLSGGQQGFGDILKHLISGVQMRPSAAMAPNSAGQNGMNIQVFGVLSGENIVLSSNNYTNNRNRRFGI